MFANALLAASVGLAASRNPITDVSPRRDLRRLNAGGCLCADIEHQRTLKIGDNLIDERINKVSALLVPSYVYSINTFIPWRQPPIKIPISKVMQQSEKSHV